MSCSVSVCTNSFSILGGSPATSSCACCNLQWRKSPMFELIGESAHDGGRRRHAKPRPHYFNELRAPTASRNVEMGACLQELPCRQWLADSHVGDVLQQNQHSSAGLGCGCRIASADTRKESHEADTRYAGTGG